jgi:sulfite reductase (ferredoxin)
VFEAQVHLEQGDAPTAAKHAYNAMLEAARALVQREHQIQGSDPNEIVTEFRSRLYDTKRFHDPYAGGKFAHYLFRVHEHPPNGSSADAAHQLIEEAQLFIDAAHQCYARITT